MSEPPDAGDETQHQAAVDGWITFDGALTGWSSRGRRPGSAARSPGCAGWRGQPGMPGAARSGAPSGAGRSAGGGAAKPGARPGSGWSTSRGGRKGSGRGGTTLAGSCAPGQQTRGVRRPLPAAGAAAGRVRRSLGHRGRAGRRRLPGSSRPGRPAPESDQGRTAAPAWLPRPGPTRPAVHGAGTSSGASSCCRRMTSET